MSVAGILSSIGALHLGGSSATKQGLQHLKQDLQSGDLDAAQSSFAAVQKAFATGTNYSASKAAPSQTAQSTKGNSVSQVLRLFTSGVSAAIGAPSQPLSQSSSGLRQDPTPGNSAATNHLRHHLGSFSASGSSGTLMSDSGNAALQTSLLTQIGKALAADDLSSAQQASAQLAYSVAQTQPLNALSGTTVAAESPVSMLA